MRLRKYSPIIPIPDIITTQSDWQKDDEIIVTQDDLYAITWETNFGDAPFETVTNADYASDETVTNDNRTDNITQITVQPPICDNDASARTAYY